MDPELIERAGEWATCLRPADVAHGAHWAAVHLPSRLAVVKLWMADDDTAGGGRWAYQVRHIERAGWRSDLIEDPDDHAELSRRFEAAMRDLLRRMDDAR